MKKNNPKSKQNLSHSPKLNVVPHSERNEVAVDGLYDSLVGVVNHYIDNHNVSYAELLGVLRLVQIDVEKQLDD